MHRITTINPKDRARLATYDYMSDDLVSELLAKSRDAFRSWGALELGPRLERLAALESVLKEEAAALGRTTTDEMGKPLAQAVKEVEKCALACRYYLEHAGQILANERIKTEAHESYIAYRPLGPVLSIMPWNFPYWQVIRFAVPALCAGNTVLMKHADNTTGSALALERAFRRAGYPEGVFQALLIDHDGVKKVIENDAVRAVTLTGSERAGRSVAATAGTALKKTVLELGGSDAYVVLEDADIEQAAQACVDGRLVNSGQSCVAAKRFIIVKERYDEFRDAFVAKAKTKVVGDPLDPATQVGPLAKESIYAEVTRQVKDSVAQGARLALGGDPKEQAGFYYPVTVLDGVLPGMPAFDEEVFGPAAALIRAKNADDAIDLANHSRFGLGGGVFTKDLKRAQEIAERRLEAGFCVVNDHVQSDPRLPFGGVKSSGYGRELSLVGMREFVNVKSVVVKR